MPHTVLILDLDGTVIPLVDHGAGKIRPKVKKAVRDLIARGIHVSIATGRSLYKALPLVEELHVQDPSIFSDGAVIYHPKTKEFIEQWVLSIAIVDHIFSVLKDRLDDLIIQTIKEEVRYRKNMDKSKIFSMFLRCPSLQEAHRVHDLFRGDTTLSVSVLTKTWTGEPTIHINDVRATKQVAVGHLMKYYNVPAEEIVAVGDSENDLPMILAAGTGVAMGNASDAVKSIADDIAPSVEDGGVAYVIEKYFPTP